MYSKQSGHLWQVTVKILVNMLAGLIVASVPCAGQTAIDGFIPRLFQNSNHQQMPYRLFIPKAYNSAQEYPLIIWLHGAGGAGSDNILQISGDQVPGTRLWTKPEVQAKHPAFVLVPQSEGVWSEDGAALSPQLELVRAIINALKSEFRIDTKRIYLTGQSNGGIGTWEFICRRPDLFAAAILLCSGPPLPVSFAGGLARMPIWAFNGANDLIDYMTLSRQMIAAIRQAGGSPRYTEYRGVGHEVWLHAFKEPGLVDWLFAQHR
jgi:predicted peptidase